MSRNASNMPIALAVTENLTDTIVADGNILKNDPLFTSLTETRLAFLSPYLLVGWLTLCYVFYSNT